MSRIFVAMATIAILSVASARPAYAQNETAAQQKKRLVEINAKVKNTSRTLAETEKREEKLTAKLAELETSVNELRTQEEELNLTLDRQNSEAEKLKSDLETNSRNLAKLRIASLRRLRVVYMHNHQSFLESVLLVSDQNTLRRHAYFLARIRQNDQNLLEHLKEELLTKAQKARELAGVLEQQVKLKNKISVQRTTLAKKLQEQDKVVSAIRDERKKLETSLTELQNEAEKIESFLESITSREVEIPAVVGGTLPKIAFHGLARLRGALPPPVAGRALERASKSAKRKSFKDLVSTKGIYFECKVDDPIKTVANGRVMYLGRMPGLGNLAIMDHGDRYYSLYGSAGEFSVSVGGELEQGTKIGVCGADEEQASRLYFEIRKNGKAINAKEFLR